MSEDESKQASGARGSAGRDPGDGDGDVTRLLAESAEGSEEARDRLVQMVYAELRAIARVQMAGERAGHTLGATALVSEAYLKLFRPAEGPGGAAGGEDGSGDAWGDGWSDRRAFYAAAATAMRRVLIDHARSRLAEKRGGRSRRPSAGFDVDAVAAARALNPSEFLSLDEAMLRLEEVDGRAAQVTRLRFYAGLSVEAAAELMGVSKRTAIRDWNFARAWLHDQLSEEGTD